MKPSIRCALLLSLAVGMEPAWSQLPRPDHLVMVIEENRAIGQIHGNPSASYINALAGIGAVFTNSHGLTHPSQPNYLELFSGSNQGITDNTVPSGAPLTAPNLGSLLLGAGLTFGGYSEDLPAVGSLANNTGAGGYWRKHNPWSSFANVPTSANLPFAGYFPSGTGYDLLPTVSIVVPNQANDMHDGSVATADLWLFNNLAPYVDWAQTHNSLFVLTFDEDNSSTAGNDILTVLVGPMVVPGIYDQRIDHHNVLRTLEDMYGLGHAGNSANVDPLTLAAFQAVPEATPGGLGLGVGVAALALRAWKGRRPPGRG